MIDALSIASSGLRSEQKQIDVISNNVANIQTPGFKAGRVNFADVVVPEGNLGGTGTLTHGDGARIASTSTVFTPGDVKQTGNPLDLAVNGMGFFELKGADGNMVYTRDGQFHTDADGNLVNVQGLELARGLQIPAGATNVQIAADGEVTAVLAGETTPSSLGAIELTTFPAADQVASIGDNNFSATDAAGAPSYGKPGDAGYGQLQQGAVEMANVNMVDEMSSLVMAQRAYQLNARVLQASDQILDTINNLRR
ncbi:MAG TPA: flagellar hook-basal body complex protein [Xanthomonadaceae bacterium]|jgi:flagellar basal-body rod protein FlgG